MTQPDRALRLSTAHLYNQLTPADVTTADIGNVTLIPAVPQPEQKPPWQTLCERPQQVYKALATIMGQVEVWAATGALPGLDRYLTARRGARNLRQYADYHHVVTTTATIIRVGAP